METVSNGVSIARYPNTEGAALPKTIVYHRPESITSALEYLAAETNVELLAGGTFLVPRLAADVETVVDLHAAALDFVVQTDRGITLGAMLTLQSIVEEASAPDLIRLMAHREGANTFRNMATVGGSIVCANAESEFLAALLVYEASVTIERLEGEKHLPLADFLVDVEAALDGGILKSVSIVKAGETAHARVARTPADMPIVAALARRDRGGKLSLALCGVADHPILIALDAVDKLQPYTDFRGSSRYRKEMAKVLVRRVVARLNRSEEQG